MRKNRYLALFVPLAAGIMLELWYYLPSAIYVVTAITIIVFLGAVRQLLHSGSKRERWWNLSILPVVFTLSIVLFSVIVPKSIVQPLFFIDVVFLYFYFRTVYYHLHFNSPAANKHHGESLRNLSVYGNFLAAYFMSSSTYGLQAFLGVEVWLLTLIIFVFFELVVHQIFWASQIDWRRGLLFILLTGFILAEVSWAVSFLTLSYYILGLILAVCYYMIIGLARIYLSGSLDARTVKKYLFLGFFSLTIVMLSSRWL
jgi:hypothetical protein